MSSAGNQGRYDRILLLALGVAAIGLIGFVILLARTTAPPKTTPTGSRQTYAVHSNAYRFSFRYPVGWTYEASENGGLDSFGFKIIDPDGVARIGMYNTENDDAFTCKARPSSYKQKTLELKVGSEAIVAREYVCDESNGKFYFYGETRTISDMEIQIRLDKYETEVRKILESMSGVDVYWDQL